MAVGHPRQQTMTSETATPGPRVRDEFQVGDRIIAGLGDGEEYGGTIERIVLESTIMHPRGRAEVKWDDGDGNPSVGLEKIRNGTCDNTNEATTTDGNGITDDHEARSGKRSGRSDAEGEGITGRNGTGCIRRTTNTERIEEGRAGDGR